MAKLSSPRTTIERFNDACRAFQVTRARSLGLLQFGIDLNGFRHFGFRFCHLIELR